MSELGEYKQQLADIEESLKDDPENKELLELKEELITLINMLKEEEPQDKPQPQPKEAKVVEYKYSKGDEVFVKVKDEYKRGTITDISGSVVNAKYTVTLEDGFAHTTNKVYDRAPRTASEKPVVEETEPVVSSSWKKFQKKNKTSMFKSTGKIGVVGGSKGMTKKKTIGRYAPY